MFRKWIWLTTAAAILVGKACGGFDRQAQAEARRCARNASYSSDYGVYAETYSNLGRTVTSPPAYEASPQTAVPQPNYWPYTPGYDKYAGQRYGWQLPSRRAVAQIDGAVPRDAAGHVPHRGYVRTQRHRTDTVGGRLGTPNSLDSPAFGSEARSAREAAAAAQSAGQDHPGVISPSPVSSPGDRQLPTE